MVAGEQEDRVGRDLLAPLRPLDLTALGPIATTRLSKRAAIALLRDPVLDVGLDPVLDRAREPLAAVHERHVGARAEEDERRLRRRVAAADDHHPAAVAGVRPRRSSATRAAGPRRARRGAFGVVVVPGRDDDVAGAAHASTGGAPRAARAAVAQREGVALAARSPRPSRRARRAAGTCRRRGGSSERLLARRLRVRRHERQVAELEQLRCREEGHAVREAVDRVHEDALLDDLVVEAGAHGGDRGGRARRGPAPTTTRSRSRRRSSRDLSRGTEPPTHAAESQRARNSARAAPSAVDQRFRPLLESRHARPIDRNGDPVLRHGLDPDPPLLRRRVRLGRLVQPAPRQVQDAPQAAVRLPEGRRDRAARPDGEGLRVLEGAVRHLHRGRAQGDGRGDAEGHRDHRVRARRDGRPRLLRRRLLPRPRQGRREGLPAAQRGDEADRARGARQVGGARQAVPGDDPARRATGS